MSQVRRWPRRGLHAGVLAVFTLAACWMPLAWDSDLLQSHVQFLIMIPALAAIGLWLILGVPGLPEALSDSRRWWVAGLVALALWSRLSVTWSLFPDESLYSAQQLAVAGLFALAALCAGPALRSVAIAFAVGIIIQAVIAIAQGSLQHSVGLPLLGEFPLGLRIVGISVVDSGADRWIRPYGLTSHPNVLGGYCAVAVLGLSGWLYSSAQLARWRQIVRLVVAGLGVWCLCLSFSRSAWGGFVVGILALLIAWRRDTQRPPWGTLALIGTGLMILIGVFGLSYGEFVLARAGTNGETTELRSISDRRYYTGIALQAIGEHPLNGIGIGSFPSFASEVISSGPYKGWLIGDNVHNIPLLVFSELGLIGFVLWLLMWGVALWHTWRKVHDPFAIGLAAGITALLAIGLFDHYIWSMPHFVLLTLAGTAIVLSAQQPASAGAP